MKKLTKDNTLAIKRYPKGSLVLFQGEVPRYGFYVAGGCLKLYAIDNDGNERVVGFCSEGDVFPTDWLVGGSRSALFYYEALTESQLAPFEKSAATDSSDVSSRIQAQLSQEAGTSLLRNLALQQGNAANKILYFFYYLAVRHGKQVGEGLYNLGLPLTHQLIADNLGLTRETVASEVSKLKRAGVVVYRKKQYIVDKGLLIRTVGLEITSNFEQA